MTKQLKHEAKRNDMVCKEVRRGRPEVDSSGGRRSPVKLVDSEGMPESE